MLASTQVSFRVLVCRLRTNNMFKLRVLIYREFTVFLIHFTYKLCVSRAFLYWFLCVFINFCRKDVQALSVSLLMLRRWWPQISSQGMEANQGNLTKCGTTVPIDGPQMDLRTVLSIRRWILKGFQYLIFEDSKYGATEGD